MSLVGCLTAPLFTHHPLLSAKTSSLRLLQEVLKLQMMMDAEKGVCKSSICNKFYKEPGQLLKTSWSNISKTWIIETLGREFLFDRFGKNSCFLILAT